MTDPPEKSHKRLPGKDHITVHTEVFTSKKKFQIEEQEKSETNQI